MKTYALWLAVLAFAQLDVDAFGACVVAFDAVAPVTTSKRLEVEVEVRSYDTTAYKRAYDFKPRYFRSDKLNGLYSEYWQVVQTIKKLRNHLAENKKESERLAAKKIPWWAAWAKRKLQEDQAKLLTPDKVAELEVVISGLVNQRDGLRAQVEAQIDVDKDRLRTIVRNVVTREPAMLTAASDMFNFFRAKRLDPERTVTLLAGSAGAPVLPKENSEILQAVGELTRRGHRIIYDADSPLAPLIRSAGKELAFGISANPIREDVTGRSGDVVTITDPYLRLLAFGGSHEVVVTPTSIVGMAMVVNGNATASLSTGRSMGDLRAWQFDQEERGVSIGLEYGAVPEAKTAIELFGLRTEKDKARFVLGKAKEFALDDASQLTVAELEMMAEYLVFLNIGQKKIAGRRGVVVFGSAGFEQPYIGANYGLAHGIANLGLVNVTGGSGGMMKVANTAAFDAGGESIGIPIVGRSQLSGETHIPTDVHTMTIGVTDYIIRVPLLMNIRDAVVVLPGKNGTMKELATTMVMVADKSGGGVPILLVGEGYFDGLAAWMQAQPASHGFLSRVKVFDSADEATAYLGGLVQQGLIIPQLPNPQPRSARKAYEFEPLEAAPSWIIDILRPPKREP